MNQENNPYSTAFYIRLAILLLILCGAIWARYTKYPPVVRAVNQLFGPRSGAPALAPLTPEQLQNESNAAKALEGLGVAVAFGQDGAVVAVDFKGQVIDDEMAQYLANLLRLQDANLANTGFSTVQADVLGPMKELRILNLSNCAIGDKAFASWSELPALISVNVSGTGISDAGLADLLAKCPKLETLAIERCLQLDDQAASAILQSKTLLSVFATGSGLSPDQTQQINKELGNRQ